MDLTDIRDSFAYTEWANELVLDAAAALDDVTQWLWLERWRGQSHTGAGVWAQWRPEAFADVAALRATWHALANARRALLASLSESELPTPRTFKRVDGTEMTLPLVEQMQHVVNHATLHRGQVVGMIRQLGRTPPATDLTLYYAQRRRP